MDQAIKEFWDKRFSAGEYVYGKLPNDFFRSVIDNFPAGRMLIPGAGEGRDAVYAATKGWEVYCTDISAAGKVKAMKLAAENKASIQYDVCNISDARYPENYFDAIVAIYFHLHQPARINFYDNVVLWLKPGGVFISELFTPQQLQNTSGGPKEVELLATAAQLEKELQPMEIIINEEREIILNEGAFHKGKANVVRFVGRKK